MRVGLLIDASNSIKDRFTFEQQASIEFLRQVIRPRTDKAFVLAFDEVTDLTQDFTGDMNQLTRGINVIRPGGGTALWDAVFTSCRDKLMKERAEGTNGTVRKAIIVVSDGDDNQSRMTRQEAYDMAQRSGVIVYSISTNLSNIYDNGDRNLKMLAEATGGRAFSRQSFMTSALLSSRFRKSCAASIRFLTSRINLTATESTVRFRLWRTIRNSMCGRRKAISSPTNN